MQKFCVLIALIATAVAMTGCGVVSSTAPNALMLTGKVHGGQQPIAGTTIQLWAAGTSTGAAPAPTALSTPTVSGPDGTFDITALYGCPDPTTQVYLTGEGGDAGGGGYNSNISLVSALGNCASLSASTYIELNEETTVIAVNVLGQYMDLGGNIGTTIQNQSAAEMATAFSSAGLYVDPTTGVVPGPALPASLANNVSLINTMADVIAACVNSSVTISGSSSVCTELFQDSTTGPSATLQDGETLAANYVPTNTIALTIINSQGLIQSTQDSQAEFKLITAEPPFIPALKSANIPTWGFLTPGFEMIAATPTNDGNLDIQPGGAGAFAVATDAGPTPSENITFATTIEAGVPVVVTLCQTNPGNGTCLATPNATLTIASTPNATPTFSVFVQSEGDLSSHPMLYLTVTDPSNNVLGTVGVTLAN